MLQMKLEIRNAGPLIGDAAPEEPSEHDRAGALEALRDRLECVRAGPATEVHSTLLTLLEQRNIAYGLVSVQYGISVPAFAFQGDRIAADALVRSVRDPLGRAILDAFVGRGLYLHCGGESQPFPVFLLSERLFTSLKTSRRQTSDEGELADGLNQPLGKAA